MKQKEILPVIEPKDIFIGPENAPVRLMEFGDYESEACSRAQEAVTRLLEKYPELVRFNFRHFPLTRIHQKAHKAAEASIGAAQEGKFAEMHQALFDNRRNLGTISLKLYAKEVGVTNKRFLDDLMNGIYGWQVQGDLQEGLKLGVRDVPVFFINNVRFEKEPTFENLDRHIRGLLSELGHTIKPQRRKAA
jgi:protein-disulfide isomerase